MCVQPVVFNLDAACLDENQQAGSLHWPSVQCDDGPTKVYEYGNRRRRIARGWQPSRLNVHTLLWYAECTMTWTEKEKPTSFDTQSIPGLYFLDGDLIAKTQEPGLPRDWANEFRGLKYPMIEFPSGVEASLTTDEAGTVLVCIHRQMRLLYFTDREDAYQQASQLVEEHQSVERVGENDLELRLDDPKEYFLLSYDNQARQMTNLQLVGRLSFEAEYLLSLKDALLERWQQLPTEHQATMALVLLNTVMEGEWGEWMKEAIALRYPSDTDTADKSFPITRLSREDLKEVGLEDEEIARLTDEDLKDIARKMGDHYVNDWFWDELEFHAREVLDKKQR